LNEQAEALGVPFVSDRSVRFESAFNSFLYASRGLGVVLIVDSFEDIDPASREALETQVFVPFLFPPGVPSEELANRSMVIARRDESNLREALLRWEDEVFTLKGLDTVVHNGRLKQIELRLAAVAVAEPAEVGGILEWEPEDGIMPEESIAHVRRLDKAGRKAFAAAMKDHLTPNPFVNLSLLRRQLLHMDTKLSEADYHACLGSYVRRAKLPADYIDILITLGNRMDEHGVTSLVEYQGLNEREWAIQLEALMAAGIIAEIPGPRRYRLEPGIVELLSLFAPQDMTVGS
jgi:hypothetical protein